MGLLHKCVSLLCIAEALDPHRPAVIKTEHDHQAFAIGMILTAMDGDLKALGRCQEHEIPNILKRMQRHLK